MNANLHLTAAELAALLGNPDAADEAQPGGIGTSAACAASHESVQAIGMTVRALTARVEFLEGLVKELRMQAIEREHAAGALLPARGADESGVADKDVVWPHNTADEGGQPGLSRIERFGRRRG